MRISCWSADVCSSDLISLIGSQTGSVPAAFAFGKDTDRLAARLNQGLYGCRQRCAGHGLRKGDVNDNLGCRIDLSRIVALLFFLGLAQTKTRFAAARS